MCKFSLSKNDSFFVPFSKYNNVVMSNRSYKLLKDLALLHTDAFAFLIQRKFFPSFPLVRATSRA
jgi:hypothetical protein